MHTASTLQETGQQGTKTTDRATHQRGANQLILTADPNTVSCPKSVALDISQQLMCCRNMTCFMTRQPAARAVACVSVS